MATRTEVLVQRFQRLDQRLIDLMSRHGLRLLRWSLGLVFLWFGLLKVIGQTPVYDLVAETVYWVDATWFVPFLGFWEMVVGIGLILAVGLRFVLGLFWLQMAGTFLVLILMPELSFQSGNPLLLTVTGEFIIKNLVLLSAGIAIGSTARRNRPLSEVRADGQPEGTTPSEEGQRAGARDA